jgi:hypothetical protein
VFCRVLFPIQGAGTNWDNALPEIVCRWVKAVPPANKFKEQEQLEDKKLQLYRRIAGFLDGQLERSAAPVWNSSDGARPESVEREISVVRMPQATSLEWFSRLRTIFARGVDRRLVRNIIVHGSYGDFTYTSYSDLDLTVVTTDRVVEQEENIVKLRNWVECYLWPMMLAVDPLQHHGPFYLWQDLRDTYPENILPVQAYQEAWAMMGQRLKFRIAKRSSKKLSARQDLCVGHCKRLMNPEKQFFERGMSMYSLKNYLSNLMLLPCRYWQQMGRPMHKSRCFDPFYRKFPTVSRPIRMAACLRRRWPSTPCWLRNTTSVWRISPRGFRLLRTLYRRRQILEMVCTEIMPAVPRLCKAVEEDLRRHGCE